MGAKLVAYFDEAERLGGLVAKMQLASRLSMTTTYANSIADTPELLGKFEQAIRQIRADLRPSSPSDRPLTPAQAPLAPASDVNALRRQIQVYVDLMTQRSLLLGELLGTARRVNEAAADTLGIERVSVWLLDEGRTKIACTDLFERTPRRHSSGAELLAKDYPTYFAALETQRTIAAHDAHLDPRTSCFSAGYLTPLGISSMLDVPIWVAGRMIGVVCHEHLGPQRLWSADEERFAYLMSSFVALAAERSRGA